MRGLIKPAKQMQYRALKCKIKAFKQGFMMSNSIIRNCKKMLLLSKDLGFKINYYAI